LINTTVFNGWVVGAANNGTLDFQSTTITGGTIWTVGSTDLIEAASGSNFIFSAMVINSGVLEANGLGAALEIDNTSSVTNTGTLAAINGGVLIIASNVSGSGSATIGGGGTLELGGEDAQAVVFNG